VSARYVVRKVISAFITIVLIAMINFLLFRAMPGSPERVILGRTPNVTAEILQQTRQRWGLDKPLFPDQFVSYISATVQGDLGFSFVARGQRVVDVLAQRIWPTIILFGLGELLAIVIGLAIGAYSGWKRGGWGDYTGNGISLVLYSTPYFLIGMAFLIVFATTLRWFPTFGMLTAGEQYPSIVDRLTDFGSHLILPLLTVAIGLVGQYSIVMRSSIIETLSEDYVTTARAMGLTEGRILRHHALPNALLPTVSLIAINLGFVIAGAITVEVVFSWPGLGTLSVDALTARDYPVLQGVFLLLGVSVVLANLAADLLYGFLDPRVRA
jgi:peptide/nickel transport system permease protein